MNTTAIIIRNVTLRLKKIDGEWQVAWIENGKRNENKTYFGGSDNSPGSKEDAIATMKDMAKRETERQRLHRESEAILDGDTSSPDYTLI